MYIDSEHVREILDAGHAAILNDGVSRSFGEFIESLPRLAPSGFAIDWRKIPDSGSVDWYAISDERFLEWSRGMAIGRHAAVVAWFNSDEPCLVCDFDFGIANADTLFWRAPGTRYLFGADRRDAGHDFHFGHFLEFGVGSRVMGIVSGWDQ